MSWFISPIMSGMASVLLLTLIRKLIIEAKNPIKAGLLALPIIYALTIFVNVLTVTMNGSKCKKIEKYISLHLNIFLFSARHGES